MRKGLILLPCLIIFFASNVILATVSEKAFQLTPTPLVSEDFHQILELEHENLPVHFVRWSSTNKIAVVYSGYSNIEIFNGNTGKLETTLEISVGAPGVPALALEWSPDGKKLAAAFELQIFVWNFTENPPDRWEIKNKAYNPSISWSLDSNSLAQIREDKDDRLVIIADVSWKVLKAKFKSSTEQIRKIVWSPNGKYIAAFAVNPSHDPTIQFWDAEKHALLKSVNGYDEGFVLHYPLAWSPDSKTLAGLDCSKVGLCQVWFIDMITNEISIPFGEDLTPRPVNDLAWSPDGKLIAMDNGANDIEIFDVTTRKHQQTLTGHTDMVLSVSWNPDSTKLVTSGLDGTARIWEKKTVD